MDQFKEILAKLKTHHFWVLCGVVPLISLGCWLKARADLNAEFTKNKAEVEGGYKAAADVIAISNHPNPTFTEGVGVEQKKLEGLTFVAWTSLYRQQQDVLKWPDLGPDFLRIVPDLAPDAEIPVPYRNQYLNFIGGVFPGLFRIVDVRELVEIKVKPPRAAPAEGNAGRRVGPAAVAGNAPGAGQNKNNSEYRGLVAWDENQRKALIDSYTWQVTPSSLQVRYAQEDLWVYEALLNVIKNTNKDPAEHLVAPIKQIEALEVGQAASKAFLEAGNAQATGGAMPAAGGAEAMPQPGAAPGVGAGGAPGSGQGKGMSPDQQRRDFRYVDAKGVPMSGTAQPPFAEFNMMPVRLKVLIDQRRIPDLLVECANSPLSIEVRRVRMDPDTGQAKITLDAGQPNMAVASGPAARPATAVRAPDAGGNRAGQGAGPEVEEGPYDVSVELLGIVYLFNPPDSAKVGQGAGANAGTTEAAAPATGEPVAPPAATPAPAAGEPAAAPAAVPAGPPPAAGENPPAGGDAKAAGAGA